MTTNPTRLRLRREARDRLTSPTLSRARLDRASRADWKQPAINPAGHGCDACGSPGSSDDPLLIRRSGKTLTLTCQTCKGVEIHGNDQ
jgi:hypothetical protein